jgi:hypothetical protein
MLTASLHCPVLIQSSNVHSLDQVVLRILKSRGSG